MTRAPRIPWLIVALLLAMIAVLAALAGAQEPHPCDVPQSTIRQQLQTPVLPFGVGFCAKAAEMAGYVVLIDGVAQTATEYEARTANEGGLTEYWTSTTLTASPGDHELRVLIVNGLGQASEASAPLLLTVPGPPLPIVVDPCAPPLGPEVTSVFVTRWELTTKVPGSRMRVNYQLASRSPVVAIEVRVDGAVLARTEGGDLTSSGGLWLVQPGPGVHRLTVWARNAYGCTREALAPTALVIK